MIQNNYNMKKIDTKEIYSKIYEKDGLNYGGFSDGTKDPNKISTEKYQLEKIRNYLNIYGISKNKNVIELGCGYGHNHLCHEKYKGYEYSSAAVTIGREIYGDSLNITEADARNLPIPNSTIDFLFTFDALEHIPELEKVFSEIERILKPGGYALLAPAWNCRPWTVRKIQQRPYSDLNLIEKLEKLAIPLRNNLIYRMLMAIPSRAIGEIKVAFGGKNLELKYKKLDPDFTLWDKYDHIADDDAFISIDSHSAICWFRSRGWIIESHKTLFSRFSCRGEEILIKKPIKNNIYCNV